MTTTITTVDLVALHHCCEDGSLELLYQPEIDLGTGALVAMQGLLRWHHRELGPLAFLELAESSGEVGAIARWVLGEGSAEAARWQALPGPQRRLWLNVSASQLTAPGFVELVARTVADAGLPAGAMGLELTESCLDQLASAAVPVCRQLHEAGVALAIDAFHSWGATFGAADLLPVDVIKLGEGYVRGVGDDVGRDGAGDVTVAAVIDRAHARHLVVVADGVETWGEAARLTELGCDRAHGWLCPTAQPADKARWLLRAGTGWTPSTARQPRWAS